MQISEDVLFNTLAQLGKKNLDEANKTFKKDQKAFEVVRNEKTIEKVDRLQVLEYALIKHLLLYGSAKCEFDDVILKTDDSGELQEEHVVQNLKVYEKIFLELQQDEIELNNVVFKKLYDKVMAKFLHELYFELCDFIR